MALDPSRANEVRQAAQVLWTYVVPFMVAHRDAYLGFMATGESHDHAVRDNAKEDPNLDAYVEDSRSGMNIGTEELPVIVPKRGPTLRDFRAYILANAPADDQLTIQRLLKHTRLCRPVVLDKRTSKHPNSVGFYIQLEAESAADGKTYYLQRCKCFGDEQDWIDAQEAAHNVTQWTEAVEATAP